MRELLIDQAIFVGFKVNKQLREILGSLNEANRKYVSEEGSAFLRICGAGDDLYIGKIVDGRLTTDRVDDIRRNILSIVRKLGHGTGLPANLLILPCNSENGRGLFSGGNHLT